MTVDDSKPFPPRRKRPDPPVIDGDGKPIGEPTAAKSVEADPVETPVIPDVAAPEQIEPREPASAKSDEAEQPLREPADHVAADEVRPIERAEPAAWRASDATRNTEPAPHREPRPLASLLAPLAALAALAVAGLVWVGQRSDNGAMAVLESRAASLEQKLDALDKRVGAAEAALQKTTSSNADLTLGLATVDASVKSALRAAETARDEAARIGRSDGASVDLHPLEQRIADVEAAIKSPKMEGKAVADRIASPLPGELPGNAAGLVVIGHALLEAIQAGEPFQTQLNAAESLGADPAHTTILKPFAAKGVASFGTLAQQFLPLASRLATSDLSGHPAESLVDRAMGAVQRLVKVRTVGEPVGDDPDALAVQIELALKRGDGSKAGAIWEKLPAAAKGLTQAWFNDFKTVIDVQNASRAILSDAIAALAKPKS